MRDNGFHSIEARERMGQAFLGMHAFANDNDRLATLINRAPQAAQVDEVTVSTATDGASYVVTIQGVAVTIVAGTGSTKTSIRDQLIAAINTTVEVRRFVAAASSDTDKFRVTALVPGVGHTIAVGLLLAVAAITANATAEPIRIGRAVCASGAVDSDTEIGSVPMSGALTAQVAQFGYTYQASQLLELIVEVQGVTYVAHHTAATDANTSLGAIATAINANLPANTVDVVGGTPSGKLVLTSEVPGLTFRAHFRSRNAITTGVIVIDSDVVRPTDDAAYGFGIALRGYDEEILGDGSQGYPPLAGARVLRQGSVWVASPGVTAANGEVWVDVSTPGNAGRLFAAAGANRVRLPRSVAVWRGVTSRDGSLALLDVRSALT